MIAQGVHVKFIQSQLGHASIQTTLDRYGHLLPEVSRGSGERLDAMVFGDKLDGAKQASQNEIKSALVVDGLAER